MLVEKKDAMLADSLEVLKVDGWGCSMVALMVA